MIHREINKRLLFVFILCAICIAAATWTISEKFISSARVALLVNIAVAAFIGFLFERYLEAKQNRSIDAVMDKVQRICQGDLTQRFKEDPDDALPYGLAFRLGEMMRFFRESIGDLWKVSSMLIKQLNQFIQSTQEVLREFRSEVTFLSDIGRNIENVRKDTIEMGKRISDLKVNAANDLASMIKVNRLTSNTVTDIKAGKSLPKDVIGRIEEISKLASNLSGVLDDFLGMARSVSVIGKSIADLSTQSNLVKLNASIDAAQKQANEENYSKLVEETRLLLERIAQIAQDSGTASAFAENRINELSVRLNKSKANLNKGSMDAEKLDKLMNRMNEHYLKTVTAYEGVFEHIKSLTSFVDGIDIKVGVFTKTVKFSTENFDKLQSNAQITLLKFGQLEERIQAIQENLKNLEEFKNMFHIA